MSVVTGQRPVEMRGISEYMRGSGRLIRHGNDPLWGPGRHEAGDNTFTYFLDPNSNVMEYTTELEKAEDEAAWQPREVSRATPAGADQWGTGGLITDAMIPAMFNEPDKGLWTPSPAWKLGPVRGKSATGRRPHP
ncbi:hypothetical protein [Streptomyces sp. NBC_00076]|uniref:hypothetical protein n=1 Tax=Streptomyces sp. NBC_00076 TaxID=2975642 RepID=UPI00386D7140